MNYRGYLEYEIVHKPFWGTRKRAEELLRKAECEPYDIEEFISYLQKTYSKLFVMIEFIRFYDFVYHSPKGCIHYRIAMIFTAPNETIRTVLYDDGEVITFLTGWYPFVTGSRAQIKKLNYVKAREKFGIKRPHIEKLGFGKPQELINISSVSTASATLLKCYNGCILFDTGFGIKQEYIDTIDLICISHFHQDHIGGLMSILRIRKIPVLLSETTLDYVLQFVTSDEDMHIILSCAITLEELKYYHNFRNHIDYFQVFHAPGSFAFIYKFYSECSVIYLGDICLNNAFFNGMQDYVNIINEIDTRKKVIICDAALVGKKDNAIADDTPEDVVNAIESSTRKRNTIFVSPNAETLVYSYLLLFRWAINNKNSKVKIVVSDDIYNLLKTVWRPLVYRDNFKDLFIDKVLKSDVNFVETYRLYPLSSIEGIKNIMNTVCFLTVNDLESYASIIPIPKSDVILAGIWTVRDGIPDVVAKNSPRSIIRVSSADWSFHSNENDLIAFAKQVCQVEDNRIIFFHNYSKVLRKFIKKNGLDEFSDASCESGVTLAWL